MEMEMEGSNRARNMEAAARGLVVGSHNRDEVVLIYNHGELWEKPKPISDDEQSKGKVCSLCGDEIGVTEEGEAFVGCNDCAFPICRACYEYERREGAQVCPQCKTRFKRLKGSARVAGDDDDEEDDDDDLDDLENDPSEDLAVHGHGRAAWKKRLERWKSRQRQLHRSKGERGSKDIDNDEDDDDGSSEKGPADSPL